MFDEPSPEQTSAPTFTEQPPDVYAACRELLSNWQAKRKRWPAMMDRHIEKAARWWVDEMQEPWCKASEMPRLTSVQGNSDKQRWLSPYQDRLVSNLQAFLRLSHDKQRIVIAAREDKFWWRGEHEEVWRKNPETGEQEKIWVYMMVLNECERQRELGTEAYRAEALARMRKLKIAKSLPYDQRKLYGGNETP